MTNSFGHYKFTEVPAGQSSVVAVNHKKYVFKPASQVLQVTEVMEDVNFTAYD